MINDQLDVLVVSPHPDDAEISVGGTIVRCLEEGMRVGIVELTDGEPTPNGTRELRAKETEAASAVLGVSWRENLGLPNRQLAHTLDSRQALANVFRKTRPGIILAPYWEDAHPDHVVASDLVDAARFWSKLTRTDERGQLPLEGEPFWPPRLFYFWSIHLRIHPKASFVLDVSDQIERKMEAVRCFESQVIAGRSTEHPTILDDIRDRARYWGWTIGTAFAEPFACREEVGINSFSALK
ncbi:MAG: bacillithiol biosynthesis deacetylase BshB1 [Planctomycetota bacterium]|nr:bacillithiol biosynthesis deacetylase BshB1 [Planctomycetota bacterium]MDA1248536.1 bacillithiol biosynthesis deacetylase BshB1 [Planctomycetota bacterium]